MVQMLTSVFLIYLTITTISLPVWNALFWLMVLFNTINSISKGFLQETEGKMLYYHSICKPEALIISKIIFNSLVSLFLLMVFVAAYSWIFGFKIQIFWQYLIIAVLFTIGISSVFTLVSAIAMGAGNNHILIPVLGLPLIIPVLLVTVKSAKKAMDGIESTSIYYDLMVLALLDLMLIYLAIILYKYVWKS
jgi:heme exporter protein B